ncbi:MAG: pyridoxal phosphate-dependent aminotransferase [Acidobacteriota bacterium]|nr:pyridoxal phosphate-dependent aminotransferase [Acidobacteriota bacterium]
MRYSQRLSWSLSSNSFTRLVEAKRSAGVSLLDLTISNPTLVLSDYPHVEIAQAYSSVSDFRYRPDPFGDLAARQAVSSYYRRRGIQVDADRIALTASTSEAYSVLFKLLCDPGDQVLAPVPSYPLFDYLAKLESVRAVPYSLHYDGSWFTDLEDVRRKISSATRAIIVVNPNNPTGSFLKSSEAQALIAIANENNLPVIADEVFADYSLANAPGRVESFAAFDSVLSFSMNGLSKIAGMPQMKLGWIVLNGRPEHVAAVRNRLELLLDTYLSVNTPVQRALPALFEIGEGIQIQLKDRILLNWETARQVLKDSPTHCLHTEGGWSAVVQLPKNLSEDTWITRLLEDRNVFVQPGYFFDMPAEAYVVVSLITPPDDFREGMRLLRQLAVSEETGILRT